MKSAVLVFPGINRERDMARTLKLVSGHEPAMVWHAETSLPKGTDLSGYHPDYLAYVANELNDRPRKRLDWDTPTEALTALLSKPTDPDGVALAG